VASARRTRRPRRAWAWSARRRDLDQATTAAIRSAQLKDRFLELNPERQGGEPVIRGA
jgi:hypothetical protein